CAQVDMSTSPPTSTTGQPPCEDTAIRNRCTGVTSTPLPAPPNAKRSPAQGLTHPPYRRWAAGHRPRSGLPADGPTRKPDAKGGAARKTLFKRFRAAPPGTANVPLLSPGADLGAELT